MTDYDIVTVNFIPLFVVTQIIVLEIVKLKVTIILMAYVVFVKGDIMLGETFDYSC